MNMDFKRKLTIPAELKQQYPCTPEMTAVFEARDRELKDILSGRSNRLALIIGPCSADREDSVLDYISRLVPVQEQVLPVLRQEPVLVLGLLQVLLRRRLLQLQLHKSFR